MSKEVIVIEEFETVAITPLPPGWLNIYDQSEEEEGAISVEACPALLLQEYRAVKKYSPPGVLVENDSFEAPYQTRVVFASNDNCGGVDPATDIANYKETVPPGTDLSNYGKLV